MKRTPPESQAHTRVPSSPKHSTGGNLIATLPHGLILQRCCFVAAALQVLAGGAFSSWNSVASEESAAHQ